MSKVKACVVCKDKKGKCKICVMGIKMFELVVPKDSEAEWTIGRVVGMSRFDLGIGPLLEITDIISGKTFKLFPMYVDKMVRVVLNNPAKREVN